MFRPGRSEGSLSERGGAFSTVMDASPPGILERKLDVYTKKERMKLRKD